MTEGSDERTAVAALSQLAPLFAGGQGSLRDLHLLLLTAPTRLTHPVRLAVVGQIKKGKSTLVNALLGRQLAATGPLETTFRINEFRYGDREIAHAHYFDERLGRDRVEEVPIPELYGLTVRDPAREAELRGLTRIVVDLPEPLLLSFDLIDTPGLSSIYVKDSKHPRPARPAAGCRANQGERHRIGQGGSRPLPFQPRPGPWLTPKSSPSSWATREGASSAPAGARRG